MSPKIHLDFRLNEVGVELSSLRDYHDLLVSEFKRLEESAVERAESGWDLSDPVERQTAWQMVDFTKQIELPRLLWGSFLVMAWAVFETAVIEIADLLRTAHEIPLRINELKGNLEVQTKRYFNDVLKFPFTDFEAPPWEQIVHTGRVRNVLAHSAGRLDMVPARTRPGIDKTISQNIGVSVDTLLGEYLVVNQDFAAASLDAIETVLKDAVERAKKEHDRLKATEA